MSNNHPAPMNPIPDEILMALYERTLAKMPNEQIAREVANAGIDIDSFMEKVSDMLAHYESEQPSSILVLSSLGRNATEQETTRPKAVGATWTLPAEVWKYIALSLQATFMTAALAGGVRGVRTLGNLEPSKEECNSIVPHLPEDTPPAPAALHWFLKELSNLDGIVSLTLRYLGTSPTPSTPPVVTLCIDDEELYPEREPYYQDWTGELQLNVFGDLRDEPFDLVYDIISADELILHLRSKASDLPS